MFLRPARFFLPEKAQLDFLRRVLLPQLGFHAVFHVYFYILRKQSSTIPKKFFKCHANRICLTGGLTMV